MRFLRKSLTGLFLLSVTIGLLWFAGKMVFNAYQEKVAQENRAPQGRERVYAVNVVKVEPGEVTPELIAFGQVKSRRSLEVRAKASGTIVQISDDFIEGGRVEEGQFLLQVDPTNAEYAIDRLTNDLRDAEVEKRDALRSLDLAGDELEAAMAQADLRQRALTRQNDLQTRGVGTSAAAEAAELALAAANQATLSRRQAVAQAEGRREQAETRLERTRIALDEAQRDLAETTLVADFTGTLSEVNVVKGRLVSANEKLATLVDSDALEVSFRVSTSQYVRLLDENGDLRSSEVKVDLDVLGQDLNSNGVVTREGAVVGEGQTGRQIFAQLDTAGGFKPGDFVTVHVRENALTEVVELPATALDATGQILVVDDRERLELVPVALLRRQADTVIVRGDALQDRLVVTRRTPLLGQGIQVKPLIAGQPTQPEAPEMVELTDDQRVAMIAFVRDNKKMPDTMRDRILGALEKDKVPSKLVKRLQDRMGG